MSSFNAPLADIPELGKNAKGWDRAEALLDKGSEWLNPILVKEARQALKSRQFVITFGLLLLFGWAWTLLGVSLSSPGIFYGAEGKGMLYGYFLVLAVPLLVVVPFSAFRSLAAEREDGTFELISITSLNSRQIVGGKLGSAILQMMVYFSALAPCVAFTYLLRGVDIFTIFFVLYYTFVMSLLLSTLGLLVATATRSRAWQVLLSVLLLLILFIVCIIWVWSIYGSLWEDLWRVDHWGYWAGHAAALSGIASTFVLLLWAAGAQISFPSDNRSSRLRYVMLAQQCLWVGWMTFIWYLENEPEILAIMAMMAGIYWAFLGALLIGEYPQLSPRVKRELPQSFFGRMLLTWFNPGSGSGYVFVVLNMASVALLALLLFGFREYVIGFNTGRGGRLDNCIWMTIMVTAYLAGYLGMARIAVMLARQVAAVGLVFSFLLTLLLVVAGVAFPLLFQFWIFNYRLDEYTELQATNFIWTIVHTMDRDITSKPLVPLFVIGFSSLIFFVNLVLSAREVGQLRMIAPQRVLEDEAALHPAAKPKKNSPWDDEPLETELPPGA